MMPISMGQAGQTVKSDDTCSYDPACGTGAFIDGGAAKPKRQQIEEETNERPCNPWRERASQSTNAY
jgi:hypothetical protein